MTPSETAQKVAPEIEAAWREEHGDLPKAGWIVSASCDDPGECVMHAFNAAEVYLAVAALIFGNPANSEGHEEEVEGVAIGATRDGMVSFEDGGLSISGCAHFDLAPKTHCSHCRRPREFTGTCGVGGCPLGNDF